MISEFALLIFATLGAVGLYVAATLIPVKEKKKMNLLITAIPLALLAISGVVVRQGARSWVPAAGSRRTGAPGVHAYPRWLQQSDV